MRTILHEDDLGKGGGGGVWPLVGDHEGSVTSGGGGVILGRG